MAEPILLERNFFRDQSLANSGSIAIGALLTVFNPTGYRQKEEAKCGSATLSGAVAERIPQALYFVIEIFGQFSINVNILMPQFPLLISIFFLSFLFGSRLRILLNSLPLSLFTVVACHSGPTPPALITLI